MAKKKQAVLPTVYELDTTLTVDGTIYNVNAAHADIAALANSATVADKVAHKLKASKINLTENGAPNTENIETDLFAFDGSAANNSSSSIRIFLCK